MPLTVKTTKQEDIRRFTITDNASFEDLLRILNHLYPGFSDSLLIKYKDDEGDFVTITSSEEFREAVRLSKTLKPVILRLELTSNDLMEDLDWISISEPVQYCQEPKTPEVDNFDASFIFEQLKVMEIQKIIQDKPQTTPPTPSFIEPPRKQPIREQVAFLSATTAEECKALSVETANVCRSLSQKTSASCDEYSQGISFETNKMSKDVMHRCESLFKQTANETEQSSDRVLEDVHRYSDMALKETMIYSRMAMDLTKGPNLLMEQCFGLSNQIAAQCNELSAATVALVMQQ